MLLYPEAPPRSRPTLTIPAPRTCSQSPSSTRSRLSAIQHARTRHCPAHPAGRRLAPACAPARPRRPLRSEACRAARRRGPPLQDVWLVPDERHFPVACRPNRRQRAHGYLVQRVRDQLPPRTREAAPGRPPRSRRTCLRRRTGTPLHPEGGQASATSPRRTPSRASDDRQDAD